MSVRSTVVRLLLPLVLASAAVAQAPPRSSVLPHATDPNDHHNYHERGQFVAEDSMVGTLNGGGLGWSSIALSETTVIIGAPWDDQNGRQAGAAYLFDLTTQRQVAKLLPVDSDAGASFGHAVAIGAAVALVGEINQSNQGASYLFDTATGVLLAKLRAADGSIGDLFGASVALSGTTAIVGAPWSFDDDGAAYLFDVTSGLQIAKLKPTDTDMDSRFGTSVGISGTTAVVGAPHANGYAGAVYVFDTVTGVQLAKLVANNGLLGAHVAISAGTVMASAAHAAYLFDAATGAQNFRLPLFGSNSQKTIAIRGEIAVVGEPEWYIGFGGYPLNKGRVSVFDTTSGALVTQLTASDSEIDDYFGRAVAIRGGRILVGTPGDRPFGSVYVFQK